MNDMTDWRGKADEDLTQEDLAEMRRRAQPVEPGAPLPGAGRFVTAVPTYATTGQATEHQFRLSNPALLNV